MQERLNTGLNTSDGAFLLFYFCLAFGKSLVNQLNHNLFNPMNNFNVYFIAQASVLFIHLQNEIVGRGIFQSLKSNMILFDPLVLLIVHLIEVEYFLY